MPKRGQVPALDDMKVEKVDCLIMGHKAPAVPLPTIKECGVTCVPINGSDHWLTQVISGRCRGDASLVAKEFIDEVLSVLGTADCGGGETGGKNAVAAEGAGASSHTPKGRAAMGLDDDSDEAELAVVPRDVRGCYGPRKARKLTPKELRTISCRGMELTVKARDKIRGIAVPLEGPTLLMILKHLRERVAAGAVPEPDLAKSALRKEAMSNRDDEDAGRLRWMSAESAYQIMWHDEDGKFHRRTKGLQVPRVDTNGQPMPPDVFKRWRMQVLSKARALWNELDKTAAERYDDVDMTA